MNLGVIIRFGIRRQSASCTLQLYTCFIFKEYYSTQPATYSGPIWKADLLNELPQYFRTSPFQKSGDCNSKSDPKEESLDQKEAQH